MDGYFCLFGIFFIFVANVAGEYEVSIKEKMTEKRKNLRLPGDLMPIHYTIKLEPTLEPAFKFKGDVKIQFQCLKSTSTIIVHVKNLTIEDNSITLSADDKKSNIPRVSKYFEVEEKNFLVIQLTSALKSSYIYTLTIKYEGILADDMSGFYRSSYDDRNGIKRWLATTQFEPTDARKAFPCFDEPAFKAVFQVIIIRPKDMIALSNSELKESVPSGNGQYITDYFNPTVVMSTYLLAFVVCDFDFKETKTQRGISVRAWAQKDLIEQLVYAVNLAAETIDYYEDYFGINFPLNKMDLVAIPDFAPGAMENWGIITFRESRLLFNEKKITTWIKQRLTITITHELAHQWFGNLVTMEWWDDLWLNEGFATAMEYIAAGHVFPDWHMEDQFVGLDYKDALESDSFTASHPISAHVVNPDEINEIFDDISYSKGASLIRMMIFILSSDTFRKGINKYLGEKSYKNAIQDDLWQALSDAALEDGQIIDVAKTMDTWTLKMGYPVVTILRDYDQQQTLLTQQYFTQYLGSVAPTDKIYTWEIPLTFTTEAEQNWDKPKIFWLHQTNETSDALLAQENEWIVGNCKQLGYYRVNYDVQNWKLLIKQLKTDHKAIHANNRAQIMFDSLSLARAGLLDYPVALNTTLYLYKEEDFITWKMILSTFLDIYYLLTGSCHTKEFRLYVVKQLYPSYKYVGWEEDLQNDPPLKLLFREQVLKYTCLYGHKQCVGEATKRFREWKRSPEVVRLPQNLRQIIICTGIHYGHSEDWNFVWKQYLQAKEAAEKNIFLEALTCSKDKKILQNLCHMTLNSSDIRRQDGPLLLYNIASRSAGYKLIWNFIRKNWDAIKERFQSTSYYVAGVLEALSSFLTKQEQLNEIKDFIQKNQNNLGSFKRAFQKGTEKIQSNIIWMENYEEIVLNWFKNQK